MRPHHWLLLVGLVLVYAGLTSFPRLPADLKVWHPNFAFRSRRPPSILTLLGNRHNDGCALYAVGHNPDLVRVSRPTE